MTKEGEGMYQDDLHDLTHLLTVIRMAEDNQKIVYLANKKRWRQVDKILAKMNAKEPYRFEHEPTRNNR